MARENPAVMVPTLSKAFEIQRLRVLVEVAHRGSVSRAAEGLGLTQPTVSLHLKALNEALGVAVVERRGRGIRLTEAGLLLETHARRALAELERAQEALGAQRDLATGSLRVGAGVSIGTEVIPQVVRGFQDRHPSIEVELEVGSTGAIAELLKRGELHVGVVGEIQPHPELEAKTLGADRLVGVVAADSPLAKKRKAGRDDRWLKSKSRAGSRWRRRSGSCAASTTRGVLPNALSWSCSWSSSAKPGGRSSSLPGSTSRRQPGSKN